MYMYVLICTYMYISVHITQVLAVYPEAGGPALLAYMYI